MAKEEDQGGLVDHDLVQVEEESFFEGTASECEAACSSVVVERVEADRSSLVHFRFLLLAVVAVVV